MKHEIKLGDAVYFLYSQHLLRGYVKRINTKTYTIQFTFWGAKVDKTVTKDRVAHYDDEFTVVWDTNVGVEGRYLIDYDNYPEHNSPGSEWHQPYTYHKI